MAADAEAEADESTVESAEDVADIGTFELTEAHAAAPEPEAVEPDAARRGRASSIGTGVRRGCDRSMCVTRRSPKRLATCPKPATPCIRRGLRTTDEATDGDESATSRGRRAHATAPDDRTRGLGAEEAGAEDTAADDAGSRTFGRRDL